MPEQAKAQDAPLIGLGQSVLPDLDQQDHQPDAADRDVQAVCPDKEPEGRQERAGPRSGADVPQVLELQQFHHKEPKAEQPGHDQPAHHAALVALGLRAPHGTGIGDAIHAALLAALAPQLDTRPAIDRLFAWLAPARGALRTEGACEAIEALLAPWADRDPGDVLRSHLAETLIRHYQDPRVMPGGAWTGMRPDRLDILLRWLTREDMQFFCDVVTLTQDSHMWPPRRDFWLRLYDEGRIHAAWVAFSDSAAVLARRRLSPEGEGALGRFGRQTAGGRRANTSLLVMRIGRHVVVDGCHNYMTHIFDAEAPEAPRLYRAEYDCEAIRRDSDLHRAHSHIGHWADWVERHI